MFRLHMIISMAAGLSLLTACGPSERWLLNRTTPNVRCGTSPLTIGPNARTDGMGNVWWTASCAGRTYSCRQRKVADGIYPNSCEETESSIERTTAKMAIDRVVLETGCNRNKVKIESQSEWSQGGRRAYRVFACGKRFVCSPTRDTAGVDCEPATLTKAPDKRGPTPVSRAEGYRVLKAVEPEMRACLKQSEAAVKVGFQVNGDGSAIYLGASPTPPVEVTSCLRGLFNTVRFRSTSADPISAHFVVTPREVAPAAEPDAGAPPIDDSP